MQEEGRLNNDDGVAADRVEGKADGLCQPKSRSSTNHGRVQLILEDRITDQADGQGTKYPNGGGGKELMWNSEKYAKGTSGHAPGACCARHCFGIKICSHDKLTWLYLHCHDSAACGKCTFHFDKVNPLFQTDHNKFESLVPKAKLICRICHFLVCVVQVNRTRNL